MKITSIESGDSDARTYDAAYEAGQLRPCAAERASSRAQVAAPCVIAVSSYRRVRTTRRPRVGGLLNLRPLRLSSRGTLFFGSRANCVLICKFRRLGDRVRKPILVISLYFG